MNLAQITRLSFCTAILGLAYSALGQPFNMEPIKYASLGKDILGNSLGEIITLRWETVPERVWSVESSTNMVDWFQAQTSPSALLRVSSSNSNRTEVQFDAPVASSTFYRIRKLPMTDIGTLTPTSRDLPQLWDANDQARVVGAFDPYVSGIGFTWAPGGQIVSFGPESVAIAVNNQNMVVGYYYGGSFGRIGGIFSWTPSGGITNMGPGVAVDVNEYGHILGYETRSAPFGSRAFLWKPSTGRIYLPDLDPAAGSTTPGALSDAGHVVGSSRTASGDYHAFVWTETGGMIDLGGFNSSASVVNNNGQVIGTRSLTSGGVSRGFFWSASAGMTNFPENSYPFDLNNQGQVALRYVGLDFTLHGAVFSQSGGLVDFGTFLGGTPFNIGQLAINEVGHVAGYASVQGVGYLGFFWSPSAGMIKLETLAAPQAVAALINNNGVRFGIGLTADYAEKHVVMWDPISPP